MAKIQEIELEGQKQIIESIADLIDKMVRKGGKEAEKRLSNFKVTVNNVDFTIDDDNLQKQILDMITEAHKSVVEGSKKIKKDLNMFLRNFEELNFGDDSMEIKMPDVKLDKKSLKGAKEETKEWAKILAMREKIFKNIDAYRNAKGSTDKDTLTPAYYNSIIQLKELLRLTDEYNSKYNKSKKIDFSGIGERTFNKEYNKILDNATDFDIDEDGSIVTQLSKMVDKMYDNAVNSAIKGNEKLQDQIQSYYRNIFSGLSRSVGGDVTNKEIEKVAGKIISDLENKNEELKKEIEKLTSENVNLKETNSSNDINSSEIQDKLAKTESELANVRTELSEKTGELAEKDSKIADITSELSEKDSKLVDMESELVNVKSELSEKDTKLTNTESELANVRTELSEKTGELAEKDSKIANITSELSEKDSKLVDMESELVNVRSELSEKDTKLTNTESELANVRTELSEKDNKLTDSESEITNIRSQLANKDSELANKEKELNKVSEEVVKTNEKLEASYAELYEEKEKGRSLTIENDKNKEFNDKLSHSINELNIKYDSLEGKIKDITETIDRLKSELKGVSGEGFDNVKGSAEALDSQLMDLEHDFLSLGKTLQDRVDYLSFGVLETTVNNVVEKVDLLNTAIKEIGNGKKVDVSTFEKLGNEVDEIKSQMKEMFNASGIVSESDEVLQSLKKEGEQAQNTKNEIDMLVDILKNISTSDGIQAEINKLGELEDKLGNVITAVENKTKAFTNERNTVIDEVDKEIKKLKDLHEAVATISRTVNGMTFGEASLNSIDAFFTKLSESVDKFNDTLSENTGADKFINSIKEITSKSNELQNLAKIMTSSEKKVKDTAKKLSVQTEAEEQIVSEKKLLAFRTKVRNMMNSELSVTRQFKDELSDLYKSLNTSKTVAEFEELETVFLQIKDQISKTGDANKTVLGLQDKLAKARKNTLGHTSEYSELLDRVEKKVKSISNGFSRLPDLTDKGVEKLRRDVLIAEELLSRANSDKFKQADLSAINRLRSNIKETLGGIVDSKGVEKEVARLNKILNSLDTPQSVRDLEKAQKAYKNTLASMKSARSIPDSARAIRKEIDSMLDSNDSKKTDEYRESLIRVDDEFNTLIEDFKNGVVSADSFAISLGRIKDSLKSLSSDKYNIASFDDRSSLDMSIKEYLNKNQLGLTKGQSNALGKLRRELNDASTSMTVKRYNEIVSSFKKIKFAISDTVAIVPEVKKLRGEIDRLIDMDDTDKTEEYKVKLLEIDDNLNQSIKDFDRGKISVDTFNASLEKTKTDLKSLKDDNYTLASIGDKNKASNNIKDFINKNITNLKTEQVDELRGMINALSDDGLTKKGLLEISSDFEKIKLAMSDTVAMSPEVKKLQGEIDKLLNSDNTNKTKDYRTELSLAHGSLESLIRLFDKGELSVNYFNNRLGEIRDKIKGLDDDNYTLASIADKDKLSNNIKSFINKNAGGLADEQVSGLKELINMLSDDSLTKAGLDNISSSFEKMKFAISDTVAIAPEVKKLRGEIDKLLNAENSDKILEYNKKLDLTSASLDGTIRMFDRGLLSVDDFNLSLESVEKTLKELKDEEDKYTYASYDDKNNLARNIKNYINKNVANMNDFSTHDLRDILNTLSSVSTLTKADLNDLSKSFDNVKFWDSDTVATSSKVKKLREEIDKLLNSDNVDKTEDYKDGLLSIDGELNGLIDKFDRGKIASEEFNKSLLGIRNKLLSLNGDEYTFASIDDKNKLSENIKSFINKNVASLNDVQANKLKELMNNLNDDSLNKKAFKEISNSFENIKFSILDTVAIAPEVRKLRSEIDGLINSDDSDKTESYKNKLLEIDTALKESIDDFDKGVVSVDNFNASLESIKTGLKSLNSNEYFLASLTDRNKLSENIKGFINKNATNLNDSQIEELRGMIASLTSDTLTKSGLSEVSTLFNNMKFAITDTVAMSSEVKKLRGEIDRLINSDNTNKTQEYKNSLLSIDEELKDLIVSFDKGEKSSKEFNESLLGMRNKLSSLNGDEYIKESDNNRKKMANNIQSFINSNIGSIDESQLARLREIVAELNNLENEMTRSKFTSFSDTFDNVRYSISDTVANSPKIKKLKNDIDNLISLNDINKTEEYKKELLNIKIELLQLIRDFDRGAVSVDRFNYSISDMSSKLKTLNSDNAYNKASDRSRQSLANNILSFANRNITNIDSTQYDDLQRYATELNSLGSEVTVKRLEEINIEVNKIKASISSAVATSPEVKKLSKDISNLITADNTDKATEYKDALVALDTQLDNLISDFSNGKINVEQFNDGLASIRGSLNALKTNKRDYTLVSDADKSKLYNEIDSYMKSNSKAAIAYRKDFEAMFSGINTSKILPDLDNVRDAYNKIRISAREAGLEGMTLFDMISKRAKSMFATLISYISIFDIIRYVREVGVAVTQLDTAMTELKKVSDSTAGSLHRFYEESFNIADTVGTTAQQIINSTADWQRLGESLEEAKKSAQTSNVLLNVSEFENIDDATKSLVSMSQAYQELDKTDIVDKLNIIGNNFSISTDKLAEGLQRSAAALVTAGNDMDEAIALVTAGNSITQDADSVGAGLRTISLRIMGTEEAKEELASLGEETDDYVVQTKSKLQGLVKDYTAVASNNFKGFDILKDNGEYKSTYEILLGISKIYQEILETDEKAGTNRGRALLEALAGKNRANIAASILQNPDLLESVYNTSKKDYKGSAQHELDTYLDSVEGKLTQIRNEGQELSSDLLSSDEIKTALGLFKDLLDVVDNIVKNLGTIPLLIGTATGAMSLKDDIGLVHNKYNEYGNAVGLSFGNYSNKLTKDSFDDSQIDKYNKLLDDRNNKVITATEYEASYAQVMRESNLATQELIKSNQGVRIEEEQKAKVIKSSGNAAKVASVSMKALAVAGNLLAGAFVGLAIGAVVKGLDSLIITSKEAEESMGNLSSAVETMNSKHTSNIQTINSVKDRYYELSEGVNELGRNVSLTSEEYDEYKGIVSQISETMPNLTARYNEQGEKVGFLTGQIKDLNKELAEQEQREASALLADEDFAKNMKNTSAYIDKMGSGVTKFSDWFRQIDGIGDVAERIGLVATSLMSLGSAGTILSGNFLARNDKIAVKDEKNTYANRVSKINAEIQATETKLAKAQKEGYSEEKISKYTNKLTELRHELTLLQGEQAKLSEGVKASISEYATAYDKYKDLDEEHRVYVSDLINNMSDESVNKLTEDAKRLGVSSDAYMDEYAKNLVDAFANNTGRIRELTEQLFNFDFSNMSDLEIQQKVNELISKIASILNIDTNELKIRWGFEDVDQKANNMTAIMNRMSRTDPNDSTTIDVEAKKNLEEWVNLNDVSADTLQSMMDNGAKATDSFKKLDKILRKVQKDTEKLDGKEITIDAHVKTLDTAKTDLATLNESYSDYKSGKGTIDVNDLNSVADSIKSINGSTEAYQEFLDVLTHMPEDTEAVQKAYNKLVTEYINGTGVLDNLTVANVEYTASELEKMGVVNASEVAYSNLAFSIQNAEDEAELLQLGLDNCTDASVRAEMSTVDLTNATGEEVLKLAQASGMSDGLKYSLYNLAAQKLNTNAISLMTTGDINNLISLREEAGLAVEALKNVARAKAAANSGQKGNALSGKDLYWIGDSKAAEEYQKNQDKKLDNEIGDDGGLPSVYTNSGAGASSNGRGGGSSKNTSPKKTKTKKTKTKKSMSLTKTLYNWIERKLDVVAKKADRAQEKIDRLLDWDKKRNATLKALEAVEKQLDENYKASKRYYSYAKSQAKAEMKDAVAQVKKEGSKAQKKKYGKNLSQKTMNKYMNLVEEGKIGGEDIQAIKDPRIKAFVDTYIEWYEKAKAVDDELNSLTDTTKDLYDQLANNPLDKCAEQVERLSSEFEILQTKGTNDIVKLNYSFANLGKVASGVIEGVKGLGGYITGESFDTINKNANDQIKLLEKIFKQYEEAYAKAQYNFDIASGQYDRARASAVNLFANKDYKDLGVSEDVYNSIKSAIENNELIASDMITQFKASEQTILRTYLDAYQQRESTDTAVKKAKIDYEKNRQDSIAQERDINLDRFNDIKSLWDREMSDLNAQKEVLASQVALMEAYGKVYDRSNYDKQYDIEMDNIKLMKQQRDELIAYLAILPEGSSQWWDAKDAINAVNSGITEAIGNTYELKQQANAISDNLYDMYETLHGRINNELSFYEQLMEGYEDFDPVKHIATDQGLSRLFLYASQLSEAQAMAEKNAEIVKEYQKALDEANASGAERINATIMGSKVDKTITEAEQSLDDYYDKWQENILATKEMENNLIEWEISKLEEELSLAQEIVDARKDALNAEKNLHDYQRSIQDSTQNINNLQKQITVLKGDNSQEGKARVQALQKQLKDAQKSLEETEYEKYISAEQEMLDNLMEEYTTLIDEEKTHRDELLERAKLDIIANADKIGDTLNTTIEETGYKPQYTQDILSWLKGEQVQQFSNEIKDKLDAISQATKDGLGGLSVDFSKYNSDLGRLLEISEEEKKKYQKELKEAYESLNTTMEEVRKKSFAVDVAAPKITNETIVTLADGRVVISHNQTVDVKASADDPTNTGGTGSGGGSGSGGSGSSSGGNGNGQIFTDSSKTPEKEQQNNTTGANNVPKPDYSPTGVKDIVSQMHDADAQKLKEEEDAKKDMISKVWAFIDTIQRGDGLAKSLVDDSKKDFTQYGGLNQWVYEQTMDRNGKGLVLTKQGLKSLEFILGVNNDDDAFSKLYFDLGLKDPEWNHSRVDIISKFMELNGRAKKNEKSDANLYLYDHFKKVLSDENLKELTLLLGDTYNNASKSGNLYTLLKEALKGTTFSGGKIVSKKFAKGGIVDYVHGQGEDGIAMVRQGEGILTPAQTKTFMYELAPRMDDIIDASKLIKDTTANLDKVVPMGETNVEATFQFDLENVTNAGDIIKQIQTNNNVQKAIQSVTIDRIAGGSRLGVNKF